MEKLADSFSNVKTLPSGVLLLYPLKIPENRRFSDVFRGYKKWIMGINWLNRQEPGETPTIKNPAGIYLLKVNNRNTRKTIETARSEIYSKPIYTFSFVLLLCSVGTLHQTYIFATISDMSTNRLWLLVSATTDANVFILWKFYSIKQQ